MELHQVVKGLILLIITVLASSCAGLKTGAEFGIYRVDEQQTSSRTYRQDTKPLKCMFWNCDSKPARRDPAEYGS